MSIQDKASVSPQDQSLIEAVATGDSQGGLPLPTRARAIIIIVVLFALQVMDGIDQVVLAFTAPFVRKDLGIGIESLGVAFSAGFIGTAFGAVLFGTLADYIGRKIALCAAVMSFSLGCLCTVFVHSGLELIAVRLFTGLALGGLFPVVATLTFESVPRHLRASAITLVSIGAAVGVSVCGPLVAVLQPRFGWQSVFVIGGVVPAILAILAVTFIPNAVRRQDGLTQAARTRDRATHTAFDSVTSLFRHDRWKMTLVLWLAFILSAIPMFFSLSWLPSLAHSANITASVAAIGPSIFSATGLVVAMVVARIVDKVGILPVALTTCLGAPAFVLLGASFGSDTSFLVACGVAGAASVSSVNLLGVIAGLLYEDALRARGVGWAVAVMRLGAALAPWIGGFLIARALPPATMFTGLAVAPLISGLTVVVLWRITRRTGHEDGLTGSTGPRVQSAMLPARH